MIFKVRTVQNSIRKNIQKSTNKIVFKIKAMTKLYTFGEMKQLLNANLENINTNNLVRGFSID